VAAVEALRNGHTDVMTALRGDEIELVPLAEIAGKSKQVPTDLIRVANSLA